MAQINSNEDKAFVSNTSDCHKALVLAALDRYVRFALNEGIGGYDPNKYFFWFEDVELDQKVLDMCNTYAERILILLSCRDYPGSSVINLLKINELGDDLHWAYYESPGKDLLRFENVRKKLRLFFAGHGQESLDSVLRWTRYFFQTGVQQIKQFPHEIAQNIEINLKPGFMYWRQFTDRFEKYGALLAMCGFQQEIEVLKINVGLLGKNMESIDKAIQGYVDPNGFMEELAAGLEQLEEIEGVFGKIEEQVIRMDAHEV